MLLNKQNLFAYSILIYLIGYDYLFFNLEEILSLKLFIFKTYFEVLILLMLIAYFVYITKFHKFHKSVIILIIFSVLSMVFGIIVNQDIVAIIKDFKEQQM